MKFFLAEYSSLHEATVLNMQVLLHAANKENGLLLAVQPFPVGNLGENGDSI